MDSALAGGKADPYVIVRLGEHEMKTDKVCIET
jgi:hypothetical protein